jgi:hypothetical protein
LLFAFDVHSPLGSAEHRSAHRGGRRPGMAAERRRGSSRVGAVPRAREKRRELHGVGRGRGACFLLATFLCTSKEKYARPTGRNTPIQCQSRFAWREPTANASETAARVRSYADSQHRMRKPRAVGDRNVGVSNANPNRHHGRPAPAVDHAAGVPADRCMTSQHRTGSPAMVDDRDVGVRKLTPTYMLFETALPHARPLKPAATQASARR